MPPAAAQGPARRPPERAAGPNDGGKDAPKGPEQRVVRLDATPLTFKTAKAAHAKKEGESAKAYRSRLLGLIKDSKPPPVRK